MQQCFAAFIGDIQIYDIFNQMIDQSLVVYFTIDEKKEKIISVNQRNHVF